MRVSVPSEGGDHQLECSLVKQGDGRKVWSARCRIPCAGFGFTGVTVGSSEKPDAQRAEVNPEEVGRGVVFLEGFASSSSVDWHGTEMSMRALSHMEQQFKSGVPYVPSHRDDEWDQVFGRTVDAQVVSGQVRKNGDFDGPNDGFLLRVRVALDSSDPTTKKLVRSLDMGNTVGMSIGGWFTEMEVITNDDDEVERMIIHAVDLDHLATTRRPSNPDTWITEMHRSVQSLIQNSREKTAGVRASYSGDSNGERADHTDFEPHMMYDPKTGEEKMVETYEEHLRLADLGWTHQKPEEEEEEEEEETQEVPAEGEKKKHYYSRSATAFANLPVAPAEMPFKGSNVSDKQIRNHILTMFETKEGPGWAELRKANLWFDEADPENVDSYRFLIARPYDPDDPENALTETGDLHVFKDAVSASMEELESGPNLPEEDVVECMEHAQKYMEKWSGEEEGLEEEEMKGGGYYKKRAISKFEDFDFAEPMDSSWSFDLKAQDALLYEGREEGDPDWERYGRAHVYVDKSRADTKAGYKLPIAKLENGKMLVYWKGVVSAMGAVNGARGGVDISDAEKKQAYEHLAKYYEKADKEAPAFSGRAIVDETVSPVLDKQVQTSQSSHKEVDAHRGATGILTKTRPEGQPMSDHTTSEAPQPAETEQVTLEAIARSLQAQTELLKAVVAASQPAAERAVPEPVAAAPDESEALRGQIAALQERVAILAAAPQRVGRAKRLAPHHLDRTTGTFGSLVRSIETSMGDTALHAVCKRQAERRDASNKDLPTRGELLEDLRAVLGAAFADGVISDPDTRAGWR